MKRFLLIDLLWLGLILLAGLTWSHHDQSAYADRLDHYGVTEQAQRYHTNANLSLPATVKRLEAAKLNRVTVQFQSGHTVYVYSKNDPSSLPLASGQWFTDADLQSDLPVLVVGHDLAKTLYTGSTQRYLQKNGQYLPVIGVVSTRVQSPLNRVLFTNASAATTAPRLAHLRILVDGAGAKAAEAKLRQIFGAQSVSTYHYDTTAGNSWWADNGVTLLACIGLLIGALALAALAGWLTLWQAPLAVLPPLQQHWLNGLWWRAMGHIAVISLLGTAAAQWWFYFSQPWPLWLTVGFGVAIFGLALRWGLPRFQARRTQTKEIA